MEPAVEPGRRNDRRNASRSGLFVQSLRRLHGDDAKKPADPHRLLGWWEEQSYSSDSRCSQNTSITLLGVQPPACRDRIDNDRDGKLDLSDPGCRGKSSRTSEKDPRPVRSRFYLRKVSAHGSSIWFDRVEVLPDMKPKRLFPFDGHVVLRAIGLSDRAGGVRRTKRLWLGYSPQYEFRNLPSGTYRVLGSYTGDKFRLPSRVVSRILGVATPRPAPPPPSRSCDPSYPTVCIPPYPPDLDCADVPYSNFPVVGRDPHGFDGDGDGVGCEQ